MIKLIIEIIDKKLVDAANNFLCDHLPQSDSRDSSLEGSYPPWKLNFAYAPAAHTQYNRLANQKSLYRSQFIAVHEIYMRSWENIVIFSLYLQLTVSDSEQNKIILPWRLENPWDILRAPATLKLIIDYEWAPVVVIIYVQLPLPSP